MKISKHFFDNAKLVMYIHGMISRERFFLTIRMQEISREKLYARNARKICHDIRGKLCHFGENCHINL